MKKYKAWAIIEEYDEENGDGGDVGLPELLGEFDTVEEATEYIGQLGTIEPE